MHRSRVKKAAKFAAWAMALAAIAIAASAIAVYWVSSGRVFDKASIDNVPQCRAAIVLGCRKILAGGQSNMFFTRRIAAAAELYKAHKVDCLIVSGDNHIKEYDGLRQQTRSGSRYQTADPSGYYCQKNSQKPRYRPSRWRHYALSGTHA